MLNNNCEIHPEVAEDWSAFSDAGRYTRFLLPSDAGLSFAGSLFEQGIPQRTEDFFYHLPEWTLPYSPIHTKKEKAILHLSLSFKLDSLFNPK